MADLEELARRAVYDAGVIIDVDSADAPKPPLEALAVACDKLGVIRPAALERALASRR